MPLPAMVALDAACTRIAVNQAARSVFGLPDGELRLDELPIARFRHFSDRIATKAQALPLAAAVKENRPIGPVDLTLLGPDGREIATRVLTAPLSDDCGSPSGAIALFLDVANDERNAPSELRILAETIPHFVWICSPDGRVIYCNQHLLLYAGLSLPEMLKPGSFTRIVLPEDSDHVRQSWVDVVRNRSDAFEIECRIIGADGTPRWFLLRAKPFRSGSGALSYWFGTATDIDKQKRAEHAARQSEESFRTLTETVPQFIYRCGSDGQRRFVNDRFANYTGGTADDLGFTQAIHPKDRDRVTSLWDVWRETAQPLDVDLRLRGRDGTYRWFLSRRRPVRDEDGRIIEWVGSLTDITAAKNAAMSSRLLAEMTRDFGSAGRLNLSLQRAAAICAVELDATCIVDLLVGGALSRVAFAHHDRAVEDRIRMAALAEVPRDDRDHPIRHAMRQRRAQRYDGTAAQALLRSLPARSGIVVPLSGANGSVIGAITLLESCDDERVFDDTSLQLASAVGAALSERIESMYARDRERLVAVEFQRAALPLELPQLPGVSAAVTYIAGSREASVGGDWYDLFMIPDGRLAITVGDVAGSGIRAAVIMAQLRHTIRAVAHAAGDPCSVAIHSDAVLRSEYKDYFATAFFGLYDPRTRDLQYVLCGHPAPFLRTARGDVRQLDAQPNPPIGLLDLALPVTAGSLRIPDEALLFCYTDGLVEAERKPLDGLDALRSILRDEEVAASPEAIVRAVFHGEAPADDVVAMTLRFHPNR